MKRWKVNYYISFLNEERTRRQRTIEAGDIITAAAVAYERIRKPLILQSRMVKDVVILGIWMEGEEHGQKGNT